MARSMPNGTLTVDQIARYPQDYPAVSLVSINPAGSHHHPTRDARALAQGRLSLLLALEIASTGRAPQIETELRALIRLMSLENPFWGAPRIHGDLLKFGFEVAQSSVAKYIGQATRAAKPGMAHLST